MRARIVGAGAAFALAIAVDALLASAPAASADAPASLRGASFVFVIAVASPVLINPHTGYVGIWQKHIFGGLLLLVSMAGLHVGGQWTRFFDALFVAVLSAGALGLFSSSGIDVTSKSLVPDMPALVRKSATALSTALLLYAGFRTLRTALVSPSRAANLRLAVDGNATITTITTTTVRGYGVESDAATLLLAFGAAVAIGVALATFAREDEFGAFGVESVRTQLSAAAAYTGLAGYAALLYVGDQMAEMQVVFHKQACYGDGCGVAAETRRAALQTPSTACALLLVTVGLVTLNRGVRNDVFLNVAFLLAVVATLLRVDFVGVGAYADGVALVAVLACWAAVCYEARLGAFVGFAAFGIELALSSGEYGAEVIFAHVSNVTLVSAVAAGLLAAVFGAAGALCRSRALLATEAFFATTGHAICLAYFLGSSGLISSYVGGHFAFDEPAFPPQREAVVFTAKHFLPLALSAPLYDASVSLSTRTHWAAWLLPVVIPVLYGISMAVQARVTPALSPVDLWQFALFFVGSLPAWVLAGMRAA